MMDPSSEMILHPLLQCRPTGRKKRIKEAHVFDQPGAGPHFMEAYKAMFQNRLEKSQLMGLATEELVLVESTPAYLKMPFTPCRLAKFWPDTKVVMVLR